MFRVHGREKKSTPDFTDLTDWERLDLIAPSCELNSTLLKFLCAFRAALKPTSSSTPSLHVWKIAVWLTELLQTSIQSASLQYDESLVSSSFRRHHLGVCLLSFRWFPKSLYLMLFFSGFEHMSPAQHLKMNIFLQFFWFVESIFILKKTILKSTAVFYKLCNTIFNSYSWAIKLSTSTVYANGAKQCHRHKILNVKKFPQIHSMMWHTGT